jgi:hypothetical protein
LPYFCLFVAVKFGAESNPRGGVEQDPFAEQSSSVSTRAIQPSINLASTSSLAGPPSRQRSNSGTLLVSSPPRRGGGLITASEAAEFKRAGIDIVENVDDFDQTDGRSPHSLTSSWKLADAPFLSGGGAGGGIGSCVGGTPPPPPSVLSTEGSSRSSKSGSATATPAVGVGAAASLAVSSRVPTTNDFDLLCVVGMGAFGRVLQVCQRTTPTKGLTPPRVEHCWHVVQPYTLKT